MHGSTEPSAAAKEQRPPGRRFLASAKEPGADRCNEVEDLRKQVAAAEVEAFDGVNPDQLSYREEPNPAAEKELGPYVDEALKAEDDSLLPYTFECHTWARRLAFAFTEQEARSPRWRVWAQAVQNDGYIRVRVRAQHCSRQRCDAHTVPNCV